MYDKDFEDEIRAQEIALGHPSNHGCSRPKPVLRGRPLFTVCINYKEGTYKIIPAEDKK